MIEMDDKIVAIWFLSTTPEQDWMAAVRVIEEDRKYELVYRFRYYKDDKVFDSDDKKNWYKGEITATRSYVIAALRLVGQTMASAHGNQLYELLNEDGDIGKFMREFEKMPFAFVRMEPKP